MLMRTPSGEPMIDANACSYELIVSMQDYIRQHHLVKETMLRVDWVLMFLRIGTPEALARFKELTGKEITKCPAAVPPWPPKPVQRAPRGPVLVMHVENPCAPATDMHRRYGLLRDGMSREQMKAKGITDRDIRYWLAHDYIAFNKEG